MTRALVALFITAIVAEIDRRQGVIPNWIMMPALVLAGFLGWRESSIGALVCFPLPFVLGWREFIGAGDVKLFIVLGALLGAGCGLFAQAVSLIALMLAEPKIRRPMGDVILAGVTVAFTVRIGLE